MKKIIALLFVAILMVSAIGTGLAAACSHSSTRVVIQRQATCTQTGIQQRICNACGKVLSTTTIGLKPHVQATRVNPASCRATGSEEVFCRNCGKVLSAKVLPKKNHVTQTTTVDSTCTAEGYILTTCKNCGTTLSRTTIAKKNHVPQAKTVPATCTADGYVLTTCKNCGTTMNRQTLTKLGHAWNLVSQSHNVPQHVWRWKCGRCAKNATTTLNSAAQNPSPVRPALY